MQRIIPFTALLGVISAFSATAEAQCSLPPSCNAPADYCPPTCSAPDGCSNYESPSCAVPGGCSTCGPSGYSAQNCSTCDQATGGRGGRLFGGIKLLNFTKISVDNKERCCRGGRGESPSTAGNEDPQPAGTPTFTYAPVPITMMAYQPMMMQPTYAMAAAPAPAYVATRRDREDDDCNLHDVCDKLKVLEAQLATLKSSVDKMDAQESRLTALETAVKNIDEANRKQTDILEKLGAAVSGYKPSTPVPPTPEN